MEHLSFEGYATWIPSGVDRSEGWAVRRKILAGDMLGIVYDVDDNWQPRDARNGLVIVTPGPLGIDWDKQPLGEVTDKEIAKGLGVSPSTVAKARRKRKIKGTQSPRKKLVIDWDAQPLGEKFDAVIARSLGVDPSNVSKARRRRGIPCKYVDWDKQPLGKETDASIAKKVGVDPSTVGCARRVRGIAASKTVPVIDWSKEPLGKISDSDIARGLGVSPSQVARARKRLDIPAYMDGKYRRRRK